MEDIVCRDCATVDDYYTQEVTFKNNTVHIAAMCCNCDKFIQYLPQGKPPILYFGKYKGKDIRDIENLYYLTWFDENVKKTSKSIKAAVKDRIAELIKSST